MTSTDDDEIKRCLDMLVASSACTGLIHESFWKDDAAKYTRPWFA
jgi:meiotically up-regulated gene 157 (Mug157) protein